MDITFASGEKICFSWRTSGQLHIDVLAPPQPSQGWNDRTSAYPILASRDIGGEELVSFIQQFLAPILRRSLAIAAAKEPDHTL